MCGIFTYIWLSLMVNVGKYTSPMDPMGYRPSNVDLLLVDDLIYDHYIYIYIYIYCNKVILSVI